MARRPRLQITFSAIMNRNVILVSHQEGDIENLSNILQEIKEQIDTSELTSYEQMHTYETTYSCPVHLLVDKGIVFLCVTKHSDSEYLPFAFLRQVKDKFSEQPSLISRSYRAGEDEFDRDFRPVLVQILDDFNSGRADKLSQVEEQVEDVKRIMLHNVEKIIDRGERLDDLLSKAEGLESEGQEFRRQTHTVLVQARCRNLKMWIVIGVLFLIFLTVVVLFATGVIKS